MVPFFLRGWGNWEAITTSGFKHLTPADLVFIVPLLEIFLVEDLLSVLRPENSWWCSAWLRAALRFDFLGWSPESTRQRNCSGSSKMKGGIKTQGFVLWWELGCCHHPRWQHGGELSLTASRSGVPSGMTTQRASTTTAPKKRKNCHRKCVEG